MNLKQLIIFGMENSQEPVIKNPVLRAALQEPRIKVAELDNFNTPDLEQSEFLRPGETLEDWKPNPFLKPHAEGGRIGFYDGQLVKEGPNTGKYKVKFPTHTKLAKKYKGTKYGTKKDIRDLIKQRDLVAQKSYRTGIEKTASQRTLTKEMNFKNLVDEIVESGDLTALKSDVRTRGGKVPHKYIQKLWNPAIEGGKGSDAMKKLSKILGRDTNDILKLHEARVIKMKEVKAIVDTEKALAAVDPNKKKFLNLLESSDNLSLKTVAKQLKLSQLSTNDLINSVYKDIYKNSGLLGKGETTFVRYLPNKKTPLKTLLTSMNKIEGVDKIERRTINDLLDKTIGFKAANKYKNPELYKLFKSRINEYYKLKDALPEGLILNLDHPLSMKVINQLGTDARLQKINVSPITQELNLGLKAQFDKVYGNAIKNKNVTAQKAIEKIANQIELPMTQVGKHVTDPMKFKFIDQDIKSQILSSLENQNKIAKNIKNIDPNLLKAAGMEKYKLNLPEVSNDIIKKFKAAGIPCIKGVGGDCTSLADYQKGYNKIVKEAAEGSAKAIQKVGGFTKLMRAGLGAAKWTGYGLLAEAGFMIPFAVGDYASGESWKRILGNATDYGFGPMLGQSEQEEFEAALPEGSKAVEGEKAWELSEQLHKLDEQEFRPQGRIGMDQARREKSRENVITGITEEFSENLQPFLSDTPFAKDQWHQGMWTQAHEDAANTRAQIAKEKLERLQKRRDTGTIAQEDWMEDVDTRGYSTGGIMNLKK